MTKRINLPSRADHRKKVWRYVYIDSIKTKKSFDDLTEQEQYSSTADHGHLFNGCPIEYHGEDGTCFIYSDQSIPELELIAENLIKGESDITREHLDAYVERLEATPEAPKASSLGILGFILSFLAIVWENNFDLEGEGNLPADWHKDGVKPPTNVEVDDAEAASAPHSMWIKGPNNTSYTMTDASVFTINNGTLFSLEFYADGASYEMIQTGDQDGGNWDYLNTAAIIIVDDDAGSKTGRANGLGWFETGPGYLDSGFAYTPDDWNLLEFWHDFAADTFDMDLNSVSIATDCNFRYAQSQVECYCMFVRDGSTGIWFDNFQVGEEESGWTGKYLNVTNPTRVNGNLAATAVEKVNGEIST